MFNIQKLIDKANNDSLKEQTGHVYQVWDDGEITSQKSGRLFGQRTIHCLRPAITKDIDKSIKWPHVTGKNGFAFVVSSDAVSIRNALADLAICNIQALKGY